jgi:hypothetical protein
MMHHAGFDGGWRVDAMSGGASTVGIPHIHTLIHFSVPEVGGDVHTYIKIGGCV